MEVPHVDKSATVAISMRWVLGSGIGCTERHEQTRDEPFAKLPRVIAM
jgi:hypothetical protein